MSDTPTPSAGWFPDPEAAALLRYWDGAAWTDHRAPNQMELHPSGPYGAGVDGAQAHRVTVEPLLAAGVFLILAGIGRAASYLLSYDAYEISIAASIAEIVGWVGAFLAFFFAGFPSRTPGVRTLTLILVGIYGLGGLITFGISLSPVDSTRLFAVFGLIGLVNFGVGIAFAIVTLRTPGIARRLRALPISLYLGLIAFGFIAATVNAAVAAEPSLYTTSGVIVGGVSGLVPMVVGALFLAFGPGERYRNR